MIRIWGRPNSICTQRALWALEEAGVDYQLTLASATMGPDGHVSTGARPFGLVDSAEYRRMNPNGTVPTIDDDGFVLWESNAIVSYLAMSYAPNALYRADPARLARAQQWMAWTNEHLEPPLHTLVMELVRLGEDRRSAANVAAARDDILPWLAILETHLAANDHVAGDAFSLGDITTGASVYRWLVFDLDPPAMPAIAAWQSRLATRAGFRRHIQPRDHHMR